MNYQAGIIQSVPTDACYLFLVPKTGIQSVSSINRLGKYANGTEVVVGFGHSLLEQFGGIQGLTSFPVFDRTLVKIPATNDGMLCWVRGEDRGQVYHRTRQILALVSEGFELRSEVPAFRHFEGRDLTGYEDGTENPEDDAETVALVANTQNGLDGSSFLAIQQWEHDFSQFEKMSEGETDDAIGRRLSNNEEFDDAPISAHVKRTAQESFTPEAFMLRRSMPWTAGRQSGLMFAAFANSFYSFEIQMNRMAGAEDGVLDGLFQFSRPVTGNYFWCPPKSGDRLDLTALGGEFAN